MLADVFEVLRNRLYQLLAGKRNVTADTAWRLGQYFACRQSSVPDLSKVENGISGLPRRGCLGGVLSPKPHITSTMLGAVPKSRPTAIFWHMLGVVIKPLVFVVCFVFGCIRLLAQNPGWQPSPGHRQLPIWPKTPPDAQFGPPPNSETMPEPGEIDNVSRPTMTVYSPKGKNTGAAVVVFPGGGYYVLAIDLEGTEVCEWLTSKGITCVLLKYRVPNSGMHGEGPGGRRQVKPKAPMALQDAQRTVGLVRFHAAEYHIDPHKIGVLGFSAGGHLVTDISTHFEKRLYPAVDPADTQSCRPDFAVALYPGHLWIASDKFELNPDIRVTGRTPPTFLLHAENDPVDSVNNSLVYYVALKKAGVRAEMHLYAEGKHGFGLRRTNLPITRWPELVEAWLQTIGVITP